MRKVLSTFIAFLALIAFSLTASAIGHDQKNKQMDQVSDLFIGFIDEAFSDVDALEVKNSQGKDVTKQFIKQAQPFFNKKDYKSIQNIITEYDLQVSYEERTDVKFEDADEFASDATRMRSIRKYFYVNTQALDADISKEWIVTLTGEIYYDDQTNTITSVSSPVLSLEETDYELMLSPYIDSIRTASKHSKDVATFSGMYTMKAKAGQKEYIFGSHVHSFSSEID